jgi:hypothetical protein
MTTDPADADALDGAVEALVAGAVVGIPTDTVYGLAVDPRRPGATGALFALKRRPATLELPVLVAGVRQADDLVAAGELPNVSGPDPSPSWWNAGPISTGPSAVTAAPSACAVRRCRWPDSCANGSGPWPPPAPIVMENHR